uniref:Uncharacterized protein n=1 Tax=Mantoniella antarctica TaxID=81844 RepID=A0A7S0S9B7_9CHLO
MATAAAPPDGPISVASRMIDITVVIEGVRHRVKGKIGHTLAQALADSSIPLVAESCPIISMKKGPDTHVSLPPSVIAMMPEMNDEDEWFLGDIAESPSMKSSRMASTVTLNRELDGMVCAIQPNRPFRSL